MAGSGSYPYTQDMLDSTNSDPGFKNTIITGDIARLYWEANPSAWAINAVTVWKYRACDSPPVNLHYCIRTAELVTYKCSVGKNHLP